MKHSVSISLVFLLAASGIALASPGMTDTHTMDNGSMHGSMVQANTGVGVVNKVDMQNGKINLTHEPIKSLGWPGMTMNFKVKDKAMLKGIQPGQKVAFDIVMEKPGSYHIERIAPLK